MRQDTRAPWRSTYRRSAPHHSPYRGLGPAPPSAPRHEARDGTEVRHAHLHDETTRRAAHGMPAACADEQWVELLQCLRWRCSSIRVGGQVGEVGRHLNVIQTEFVTS